ncbi:CPBP family intramembrane metalloprotease [Telmatocola sphagniphila]|uniref:CPBP family intramembrane metalloprotease n=1 Tax=Telmatocola sphagniphila TaxID=1123043 RepID=A0A8E6EXT0_9BACT|nr:type II CAAX endopeptidase family protein [Telmatocola sphagniphila]QVL31958.1 CPBP family intramembrane metalloprotease [Telmatocola sphagniphila]
MSAKTSLGVNLSGFLLVFYLLWTSWAYLLFHYPAELDWGILKALVRLLVWVLPVFLYVRLVLHREPFQYLGLIQNVRKGLLYGLIASVLYPGLIAAYRMLFEEAKFQVPEKWNSWLNPILSAPLAEEILFRGFVLQQLIEITTRKKALLISAMLFAISHLPYWVLTDEMTGIDLLLAQLKIFFYGLIFGALFLIAKSLWASITLHTINNFLSIAVT